MMMKKMKKKKKKMMMMKMKMKMMMKKKKMIMRMRKMRKMRMSRYVLSWEARRSCSCKDCVKKSSRLSDSASVVPLDEEILKVPRMREKRL
jgi:hypothetical protein